MVGSGATAKAAVAVVTAPDPTPPPSLVGCLIKLITLTLLISNIFGC
jgi:hypothetical protein